MIHYPRVVACLFTHLRAEESSDFIEAHYGVPSRERPYAIVIFLYVCVFDFMIFLITCIPPHVIRNLASNWTPNLYSAHT